MGKFLYFIPGSVREEDVRGVLPWLEGWGQQRQVFSGPGGAQGWAFTAPGDPGDALYKPEEQVWRCCEGGKVWVGWWKEHPPVPGDLRRPRLVEGKEVAMGPHAWVVPRLRYFPWVWSWNEGGEMVRETAERYRGLLGRAEVALNDYQVAPGVTFTRMLDLVSEAIGVNYVVGKPELVAMGGVGQVEVNEAFDVLLGWDEYRARQAAIEEAEKKTELAPTSA